MTIQSSLNSLNDAISKEKEVAFPKKKFAFVRKPQTKPREEKKEETHTHALIIDNTAGNHLSIREVYNKTVRKTEQEYEGKENIIIENVENCEIYLPFKIKCLSQECFGLQSVRGLREWG